MAGPVDRETAFEVEENNQRKLFMRPRHYYSRRGEAEA